MLSKSYSVVREPGALSCSGRTLQGAAIVFVEGSSATVQRSACGADRVRTGDLRLAKPALSQLSYSPVLSRLPDPSGGTIRVGRGRLELPTSRLSGVRSNQLSYRPGWPVAPLVRRRRRAGWTGPRLGPSKLSTTLTQHALRSHSDHDFQA